MKILIFGASAGGQHYYQNNKNIHQVLAFIDNDENKHGTLIDGISVISPQSIANYDYEKIVVASMYVHSITEQLVQLGIKQDAIEYASKNSMKVDEFPFENPVILKKANQLINLISNLLHDVRHHFIFGTLLGIVRDGRLIPWDDDIDMSLFDADYDQVLQILLDNTDKLEDIFDISIVERFTDEGQRVSIVINCFHEGKVKFFVNFDVIHIVEDMAIQEINKNPLHYYEGFEMIPFENAMIRVPLHYEGYLQYHYGDWRVVRKNTSFFDNATTFFEPKARFKSKVAYSSTK